MMDFTTKELKEKARELADMVGNEIMDASLPFDMLELVADTLKEDYRQIEQMAEDIRKEQQETKEMIETMGGGCVWQEAEQKNMS